MGVVTLRPEGPIHSTGGWVAVNGGTGAVTTSGTDMVTYTSDQSDVTYIESPIGNVGVADLHFGTFAFPARSQIRSVRPVLRAAVIKETDGIVRVNVRLFEGIGNDYHPYGQQTDIYSAKGVQTITLGAITSNVKGEAWTQVNIDRTRLGVRRTHDWDRDRPQIRDMWLLCVYNEAPVITLTGPVDEDAATAGNQVTSTSTPTLDGTYSDPENDPMERAHWGVWPESVYSTWPAGFVPTLHIDPAKRTPGWVWYAGPVLTSSLTKQITMPLPNGSYRAYVMAADAGSEARYSATVMRQWAQAVPAPPAPTLAASVDVVNARIALSATTSASTPNTEFLRWETLVDGQWIAVRGYERVTASPGTTVVAYDRDARPGTSTQYRVRAGRVVAGSDVVSAAAEASATQTLDSWWLQDPYNASFNMRVKCYRSGNEMQEMASKERQAVFPVLGAKYPVTVADVIEGEVFDATFTLTGDTELANFERLRSQQRILLLRSQHGRGTEAQWYVRFGETRRKSTLVTQGFETTPVRRVTVECHERGRP